MAGSLKVDIDSLSSLSAYLTEAKTNVSDLLTQLKTEAGGLTTHWNDTAGSNFVSEFNSFVKESENICNEIDCINTFLNTVSDYYSKTLNDYFRMLGD